MNTPSLLPILLFGLVTSLRAENPVVIPLWPARAPGFEARRNEPEQS